MFTEADFEKLVCKILEKNGWKYIPADQLARNYSDVLVEPMVKDALIRLNPVIEEDPSRADEVLQRIRAIILSVEPHSLVTRTEGMCQLHSLVPVIRSTRMSMLSQISGYIRVLRVVNVWMLCSWSTASLLLLEN